MALQLENVSLNSISRAKEVLKALQNPDLSARLQACRNLKNQLIGNPYHKALYLQLGVLRNLLDLMKSGDEETKIQACVCIASILYDAQAETIDLAGVSQFQFNCDEHANNSFYLSFSASLLLKYVYCVQHLNFLNMGEFVLETVPIMTITRSSRICSTISHLKPLPPF